MGTLGRGLVAGAVGTTVLNAVTYLDMALRGRPASRTPEQMVDALADAVGWEVPGKGEEQDNCRNALGALSGIASGLGVGVAASAARRTGHRLPRPLGALATGAIAMAATDAPMAALGITDPRGWSGADWIGDAVPHLAYGYATHATLDALGQAEGESTVSRPSFGLVLRSTLLGVATGARTSLGLAMPTLTGDAGAVRKLGSLLAIGGELYADKLEKTPNRIDPPGLPLRAVSAAGGAGLLSHREQSAPLVPVTAAVGGALAGSFAGYRWRMIGAQRGPDWPGAVAEDAVALVLSLIASLPRRKHSSQVDRNPALQPD